MTEAETANRRPAWLPQFKHDGSAVSAVPTLSLAQRGWTVRLALGTGLPQWPLLPNSHTSRGILCCADCDFRGGPGEGSLRASGVVELHGGEQEVRQTRLTSTHVRWPKGQMGRRRAEQVLELRLGIQEGSRSVWAGRSVKSAPLG